MALPFTGNPYSLAPTMITPDGAVVTLVSRDCCPYLDDPEPSYINPAVAAPRDVVNSVTWDLDFITEEDEVSAPAESRFVSDEVSAPAESRSSRTRRGTVSAPAEPTLTNRWADLQEEEEEYEGNGSYPLLRRRRSFFVL